MSVRLNKTAIQRLMGERGLTGRALAQQMGMSDQALSAALLRGTFSHINAVKLSTALGVAYEEILAREGG